MAATHQASAIWSRPSATMVPQAGSGGGTPAPTKLSVASTKITMPTCNVATTMMVLIVPGNRWLISILEVDTPATLAKATYSILFDRLYVRRNQIIHGGATWNGSINRDQVRDGARIVEFLVPVFIDVMMDNRGHNWGPPYYPIVS